METQRVTLPATICMAVCFRINLTKPDSVRQPVTFRKLRDICIPEFIKDLTPILNDTDGPLNELVHAYTTGIEAVVDKHAPVQRKSITLRPNAQWYSDELRHAIRRNINIGNPSDIYETALDDDVMFDGIPLQRFLQATHDEVKRIITNSPNKTSDLDPIPTRLLR